MAIFIHYLLWFIHSRVYSIHSIFHGSELTQTFSYILNPLLSHYHPIIIQLSSHYHPIIIQLSSNYYPSKSALNHHVWGCIMLYHIVSMPSILVYPRASFFVHLWWFILLDDGWPESVEEQSLLLLVWRHYIPR